MSDIAILGNVGSFDLALAGADLQTDAGLDTAVILSLFCDARADADEIPDGADPRGYWGDAFAEDAGDRFGSKLWLLAREKQLQSVADRAQEYAQAALAWLVADGIAASVVVVASFPERGAIQIAVAIARPGAGAAFERQYQYVWSAYQ
ncbi:MAG: phage GP46 family protein [Bradyrhizobium sp.]